MRNRSTPTAFVKAVSQKFSRQIADGRTDGTNGTFEKGLMTAEEMDWMRRVGQAKYWKPRLLSLKG